VSRSEPCLRSSRRCRGGAAFFFVVVVPRSWHTTTPPGETAWVFAVFGGGVRGGGGLFLCGRREGGQVKPGGGGGGRPAPPRPPHRGGGGGFRWNRDPPSGGRGGSRMASVRCTARSENRSYVCTTDLCNITAGVSEPCKSHRGSSVWFTPRWATRGSLGTRSVSVSEHGGDGSNPGRPPGRVVQQQLPCR